MTAKVVKTKRIPPDGGWGWVVLMSALVVNFLIPGTVKSFGVLFVEFLHVFKASSTAASWMPALCYFLYNSLGPLSSVLSTKYSYKTVTLIGGTFAASGMMLSYFANSVSYLYVSYGLMVGIGAGLTFPPTVYIVTAYFERLRGFANGLCISGSAIGTIVLPPFLQYLLDCFGYRGAVLIMGAITLNTLVCGLLYHPVELHMLEVPVEEGIDNDALSLDEPTLDIKQHPAIEEKARLAIEQKSRPSIDEKSRPTIEEKQPVIEEKRPAEEKESPTKLQLHFQDAIHTDRDATAKQLENLAEVLDRTVLNLSVEDNESKERRESEKEQEAHGEKNVPKELSLVPLEKAEETTANEAEGTRNTDEDEESTRAKDDITFSASRRGSFINHVVARSNSKLSRIGSTKTDASTRNSYPRCPSRASTVDTTVAKNSCVNSASKFFDFSVLRDPIYLVILISNSTSAISNTNFMILLPSYAISQGFDKNSSALLLSVVSALDLIGRIGGASLSDIDFVPKYYYFVGGLGTSGIALALLPMATSYTMLAFFCALFGLSSGMYIGITTVILADMLGTEKLSSSYGISLFVNGVLQLVGPPVCGVIFESVGTYKPIFLAFGIILILGTALWAVVPLINRSKKKDVEAV